MAISVEPNINSLVSFFQFLERILEVIRDKFKGAILKYIPIMIGKLSLQPQITTSLWT